MDIEEGEPCVQCGLCCRIFGDSISPTSENLFRWLTEGRLDILMHFSACRPDGTWVRCDRLKPGDLGALSAIELFDPDTGEYPVVCPFLRRSGKRRFLCSIHTTKPEMCEQYRPWIWGETGIRSCIALRIRPSLMRRLSGEEQ